LSCFGGLSFSVYDFEFGSQEDSQFNNKKKNPISIKKRRSLPTYLKLG
jgi:hypothetical protein